MSAVTDEIKARIDLVELIGRSVPLKRSGSTYSGLCPFHQEKTPSFHVYPERRSYRCFGCGKSGSAIDWLMEREHLEFGEALRTLAGMAGVDLPARRDPQEEQVTARLYDLLARTQSFYAAALNGTAGMAARRYLAGRGVADETVELFGLGYAPGTGQALLRYLQEAAFTEEELTASGVISTSDDGRHYDFFRDRVLFPIRDQQGRTVAFGGRALGDATPKYLNTRDTLLFHKQELLFALDLARKPIAQEHRAVIVEGYMDALMAHQHGYRNVVATLGTAVTERQLALLRRLADEVVLALDSDAAGQAATWRALQVAEQSLQDGLKPVVGPSRRRMSYVPARSAELKVLTVPSAKDPDELIRADPSAWVRLVQDARPVVDFAISQIESRHDVATARGKADAAEEVADVLVGIANPVERAHYVQRVADVLRVDAASVQQAVKRKERPARGQAWRAAPSSAPAADPAAPALTPAAVLDEADSLDEYILAGILAALATDAADLHDAARQDYALKLPQSREVLAALRALPRAPTSAEELGTHLASELHPLLRRVATRLADVRRLDPDELGRDLQRARLEADKRALAARKHEVQLLLRESSDPAELAAWTAELIQIAHRLDAIEAQLRGEEPPRSSEAA